MARNLLYLESAGSEVTSNANPLSLLATPQG